jgi:hypothetical protein
VIPCVWNVSISYLKKKEPRVNLCNLLVYIVQVVSYKILLIYNLDYLVTLQPNIYFIYLKSEALLYFLVSDLFIFSVCGLLIN